MPSRRALLAGLGTAGTAALAGCSALSSIDLTPVSPGRDWLMGGRTPENDRVVPESVAPSPEMDPRWGVSLPGPESAPAVADGLLAVGANDRALAFAFGGEDGGRRLWEHEYDGGLTSRVAPVLAGETVYVVTESPPDGSARLRALDRDGGGER